MESLALMTKRLLSAGVSLDELWMRDTAVTGSWPSVVAQFEIQARGLIR